MNYPKLSIAFVLLLALTAVVALNYFAYNKNVTSGVVTSIFSPIILFVIALVVLMFFYDTS